MYRKTMQTLVNWKENKEKYAMVLTGSRGTGKTWLALDFAKNQYGDRYLYLNLEQNAKSLTERIRNWLMDLAEDTSESGASLIILDEVSFLSASYLKDDTEEAWNVLNGLQKEFSDCRLFLITSFPEFCMETPEAFCVHNLYVMDFEEYLYATGSEWYVAVIQEHYESNKPIPQIVHQELLDFFHEYLMTGGFPAAINELLDMGSTENHYMLHQQLVHQIYYDMEVLEAGETLKARAVWDSIPVQLAKPNKVFRYRYIRKGATKKQYQQAIDYLLNNQLAIRVNKFQEDESISEEDEDGYKLYYLDTGLLYSSYLHNSTAVERDEKKLKGVYENYVALMLKQNGVELYYWESDSQAKIEFIWKKGNDSIPVELRTDENTRSKSVSVFREKYKIPYSIKLSTRNFDFQKNVKYVPVYAAFCIK